MDKLEEIKEVWERAKRRNEDGKYASLPDTVVDDTLLAFAEIDRLRGLLARLEWAGTVVFDEWYDKGKCCPVCRAEVEGGTHGPSCWLAKELGR